MTRVCKLVADPPDEPDLVIFLTLDEAEGEGGVRARREGGERCFAARIYAQYSLRRLAIVLKECPQDLGEIFVNDRCTDKSESPICLVTQLAQEIEQVFKFSV